jgi:Mg-chelatase subunit ChlD
MRASSTIGHCLRKFFAILFVLLLTVDSFAQVLVSFRAAQLKKPVKHLPIRTLAASAAPQAKLFQETFQNIQRLQTGNESQFRVTRKTLAPAAYRNKNRLINRLTKVSALVPKTALIADPEPTIKAAEVAPFLASTAVEPATNPASGGAPYTEQEFQELSKLIHETPFEQMNIEFFKKVYRFKHAPDMLKLIMGKTTDGIPEKNRRLGNLRKWYDWNFNQGKYARENHVTIENTNQGKDNGARSDLDATANILDKDNAGNLNIRDKAVGGLIKHQSDMYKTDGLTPENVDVTIFNGDTWLPDFSDSRMSYSEFKRRLFANTFDLKSRPGAYYVPGAHKEQAHDRAIAEGHSIQIGWDYVANKLVINGRQVEFDDKTGEIIDSETRQPLQEYNTRDAASKGIVRRYAEVKAMENADTWRRGLGNVVQNSKEFLGHEEPLSRNKYFIERAIDQGAGRFVDWSDLSFTEAIGSMTHLSQNSYVSVHGSNLEGAQKTAWKQAFIRQAFGIPASDGQRIAEIQSVLDRSSDIQLDKTGKRHDKSQFDYLQRREFYYSAELAEAEANLRQKWQTILDKHEAINRRLAASGKPANPTPDFNEVKLKDAERLFVEKQRNIMIEGGIRVIEESFRRDFTSEGIRQWNRQGFSNKETLKKIMLERGVELALMFDAIETAPRLKPAQKEALRQRIIDAVPNEAKPLVGKLAEISRMKLMLVGNVGFEEWTKASDRISDKRPTELLEEIEREMKRVFGEDVAEKSSPIAEESARQMILETICENLGPVDRAKFIEALKTGNRAMQAKFGASAYWNKIKNDTDFLMVAGAAFALMNTYQQHCAGKQNLTDGDCLSELAFETAHQSLYALPGVNTGLIIFNGLRAINEGSLEGFVTLGLGTASLPSVARGLGLSGAAFIKLYIAYQIVKLGYAVTVGYAMQQMENDAVEQAFKALPEPGKQARRFRYPNEPWDINKASTPTTPMLSDIIQVEADNWTADQRYLKAREMFAPSIQSELEEAGLKPDTDEWNKKRVEIINRYADALPYSQRNTRIYKTFSPRVEQLVAQFKADGKDAGEDYIGLVTCLQVREQKVEDQFKAPPTFWEKIQFWRNREKDKQAALNQVWSTCVADTVKRDEIILKPVFEKYVGEWMARQSSGYQTDYNTADMKARLVNALMNEYVVKRHLDLGYENERQLEKISRKSRELAAGKIKIIGNLAQAQKENKEQLRDHLQANIERTYQGDPPAEPAEKAELKLKAPVAAVRLGNDAQIDIGVRGMRYQKNDAKNQWKVTSQSEITGINLDKPDNLVMTKALEEELNQAPKNQPRKFITIDEKLSVEVKDGTSQVITKGETSVKHYTLLPQWRGNISVLIRAEAIDNNKKKYTYPYYSARVKISGAAQGEKISSDIGDVYSSAYFSDLAPGNYSIHVEPRQGDERHTAVDATAALEDYTAAFGWVPPEGQEQKGSVFSLNRFDKDGSGASVEKGLALVRWKDSETVEITLPYVPPKEEPEKPQTQQQTGNQNKGQNQPGQNNQNSGKNPNTNPTGNNPPNQPDPQRVKDCESVIAQAQQMMAADPVQAATMLQQAQQNCKGLTPGIDSTLTNVQQQIEEAVNNALVKVRLSIENCEFEEALQQAEQLLQRLGSHPKVTSEVSPVLPALRQTAEAQRLARIPLREGMEAIKRKDLDGSIASLRQALAIPNLPACMRDKATALLRELERKKLFIDLSKQIQTATEQCNYKEAENRLGELLRISPRDPEMDTWVNTNVPKLADLKDRERRARLSIDAAEQKANEALAKASVEPVDTATVDRLIQEASQALLSADNVAPKCMDRQKLEIIRRQLEGIKGKGKPQIDVSFVLLIDTSGSMSSNNKMEQAKAAARAAAQKASKTVEIAVLNFDGECGGGAVRVAAPFTTDVNALVAAINSLRPGGGTPMYIATGVAVEYAKKNARGKQRTVVLMSDGADSCRNSAANTQAASSIRTSSIPVNSIGFDVNNDPNAQEDMRNLSSITGGRTFSASAADPKEIIRAFEVAMLPSLMKDAEFGRGGAVQSFFDRAKSSLQQQDIGGATYQLQQAYQVAPDSAAVNFNLALLYQANEKPLSAVKHAQNYLNLSPNALDRGDIQNRIAELQKTLQENTYVERNQTGCLDIANWARAEEAAAKSDAARRLAVLELRSAAQRGDCDKARTLQNAYRQRYQR